MVNPRLTVLDRPVEEDLPGRSGLLEIDAEQWAPAAHPLVESGSPADPCRVVGLVHVGHEVREDAAAFGLVGHLRCASGEVC